MNILDNKMDFTAIMIPQKTHQPMQYWSEKIRSVQSKWRKMATLTNLIKINNYKLQDHANPLKLPRGFPQ